MTPLTHQQRLALIYAPFPVVRVVPGKSWGGALISKDEVFARSRNPYDDTEAIGYSRDETVPSRRRKL